MEEKQKLLALLEEQAKRKKYNALSYFEPYPWQKAFMYASLDNRQKLAMCANQVGKTTTGAFELAYHATGLYPADWEGLRFDKPIKAWACGMTNNSTRDIVQTELLGDQGDLSLQGAGTIPKHCIGATVRKPGIPNAFDSVLVKHFNALGVHDGWSKISFLSYEMGQDKFMGQRIDWVWLDEEPPIDIFTQCVTRTLTTSGVVSMTFTPEKGLTKTVTDFLNDRKPGQFLIQATWEDVTEKRDAAGNITHRGHLTDEKKEQLLAVYSADEREMRSKGIPIAGSGPIFPLHLEDEIRCDPIEIPAHWPRICGLDFGWDHPTAAAWLAWDRDADIIYLYDAYKKSKATAIIHAAAIKARGDIPVAWPKDGHQSDKGTGINLAEQYRDQGVSMLPDYFRNKPSIADEKGNFSVEAGVQELYQRMETGRFRVFTHLNEWFQEFRQYYRKDGKINPVNDDLLSATRYGACSIERFGKTPSESKFAFSGQINYLPLGPGFRT